MVRARSLEELDFMRQSGKISAYALKKVLMFVRAGVTGLELDRIVTEEIKKRGGKIAFVTVDDYMFSTCITINEQVVHGIPTDRKLKDGDVVSIDLGCIYKGWFSDTAWSVVVGDKAKYIQENKFLNIGEEALWKGIKQAVEGNTIGDISAVIQNTVEKEGYSIVRSLVGHGIGKSLHEDPEVPGFGKAGKGLVLQKGMTLAIEVIYTKGRSNVLIEKDGWTISSADGSLGGLFEMTVIVGTSAPEVLTDWRKV